MSLSYRSGKYHFFKIQVLYVVPVIAVIVSSCGQNNIKSTSNKLPSTDSTIFFPVREYFLSQIKNVDSSTSPIHMVTTINGQKDSTTINIEQFNKTAQIFLENNIADP